MTILANQKLSPHLSYSEVKCKCKEQCDGGHVRHEVIDLFERIRGRCTERLGKDCPIHILSGVRCRVHNLEVGGAVDPPSQHTLGKALDLKTPGGIPLEDFYSICEGEAGAGGMGKYTWGFHIDTLSDPPYRRWDETNK